MGNNAGLREVTRSNATNDISYLMFWNSKWLSRWMFQYVGKKKEKENNKLRRMLEQHSQQYEDCDCISEDKKPNTEDYGWRS